MNFRFLVGLLSEGIIIRYKEYGGRLGWSWGDVLQFGGENVG